jgi:hypothetical protein
MKNKHAAAIKNEWPWHRETLPQKPFVIHNHMIFMPKLAPYGFQKFHSLLIDQKSLL